MSDTAVRYVAPVSAVESIIPGVKTFHVKKNCKVMMYLRCDTSQQSLYSVPGLEIDVLFPQDFCAIEKYVDLCLLANLKIGEEDIKFER